MSDWNETIQMLVNVDHVPPREPPDPTPEMLTDPVFLAIWGAIKGWDISRHNNGIYSGPTGNDARHIYDAICSACPEFVGYLADAHSNPQGQ